MDAGPGGPGPRRDGGSAGPAVPGGQRGRYQGVMHRRPTGAARRLIGATALGRHRDSRLVCRPDSRGQFRQDSRGRRSHSRGEFRHLCLRRGGVRRRPTSTEPAERGPKSGGFGSSADRRVGHGWAGILDERAGQDRSPEIRPGGRRGAREGAGAGRHLGRRRAAPPVSPWLSPRRCPRSWPAIARASARERPRGCCVASARSWPRSARARSSRRPGRGRGRFGRP